MKKNLFLRAVITYAVICCSLTSVADQPDNNATELQEHQTRTVAFNLNKMPVPEIGSELRIARLDEERIKEHKIAIGRTLDAFRVVKYALIATVAVGAGAALYLGKQTKMPEGVSAGAASSVEAVANGNFRVVLTPEQLVEVRNVLVDAKKSQQGIIASAKNLGGQFCDVFKQVVLWAAGSAALNEVTSKFMSEHNLFWFINHYTQLDQHVALLRQYGKLFDRRKDRLHYDVRSCEKSIVLLSSAVAQELEMVIAFMQCRVERVNATLHIRGMAYTIIEDLQYKANEFLRNVETLMVSASEEGENSSTRAESLKNLIKEFQEESTSLRESFANIC